MKRKIFAPFFLAIFVFATVYVLFGGGKEDEARTERVIEEKQESDIIEVADIEEEQVVEEEQPIAELSEEEYKNSCEPMWYDEIFFSEEDLAGKLVKLDLFVEEYRFFKVEAIGMIPYELVERNVLREFYKCGVKRESENSYVGGQIELFFSEDYGLSASDISEGDHIVAYGEIVSYSTTSFDGYNSCCFIPKYIE